MPAWIRSVDCDSPAEAAGLCAGDYILQVQGNDVRAVKHDAVVAHIKGAGSTLQLQVMSRYAWSRKFGTASDDGKHPGRHEMRTFTYTSKQNKIMSIYESLSESPYTLSVPCSLLKMLVSHIVGHPLHPCIPAYLHPCIHAFLASPLLCVPITFVMAILITRSTM